MLANASPHRRVAREQLAEIAHVSHTVRDYLAELEQQNPVPDPPPEPPPASGTLSATDPDPILPGLRTTAVVRAFRLEGPLGYEGD